MSKTINDITEVKIGHLKEHQKAEILSLQVKYSILNAMEDVADHLRPQVEQISLALSNFFNSINQLIIENEKDNKDK